MTTETLRCQVGGHKWSRTVTPGRKPTHCPDHLWVKLGLPDPLAAPQSPPEPPPAPKPEPEEPKEKTVKHPAEQKAQAEVALASDRVGQEAKRKIQYCYDRFERGAGTSYLLNTYKAILRGVKRL